MTAESTLRLNRLELQNFRCFVECAVDFDPKLTVLVAENGCGKTAILDAAALALSSFVDKLTGTKRSTFRSDDVRRVLGKDGKMQEIRPTTFIAQGLFEGNSITWRRSRFGGTDHKNARDAEYAAVALRQQLLENSDQPDGIQPPSLPLVAMYGTGRLWDQQRLTERRARTSPTAMGRLGGYIDCLLPSSSFRAFLAWYSEIMREIKETPVTGKKNLDRLEMQLSAVNKAIKTALIPSGWKTLSWDSTNWQLVVEHSDHGMLPLNNLSDGVRNMVALVADVAHRCIRLNPHLGESAAKSTSGVLLIDEVDMHLHPRWQQQVLDLLHQAFPSIQLIVSTHSPQVLSTVNNRAIRIVRHCGNHQSIEEPSFQSRGTLSADVLAAIMDVDPVPNLSEVESLGRYRSMIEDGKADSPEASELEGELIDHFGADHPFMLECEQLVRFQKFRLKRKFGQEGEDSHEVS